MKIILIGIQGSGKSTQGNLLSSKFKLPYLSSGHIFREMTKEKTKWGRYVKETMNAGHLIPDTETIAIINEYLGKAEYKNGYILDGFPRTITQAQQFKDGADAVVYLHISDKEALKRLSLRKSEREDDTSEAIKKRIELFHSFTEPVLAYYREKGILHEVDGEKSIDHIHKEIVKRLK